jgi:hypothetical protein
MSYDIIGDIHGHAGKLEALLAQMEYRPGADGWRHPARTAIFVGDFIDLGERGVDTVRIVRRMVESGAAHAVMGNHELNAIAWHTRHPRRRGEHLRPRHGKLGEDNRKQHQAFLADVEEDSAQHKEIIDWFLTLPLWLELEGLRVVHACWHLPFMAWLSPRLRDGRYLTPELMVEATEEPADQSEKDNASPSVFKAVEALTKGLEIPLPPGRYFVDAHGTRRDRVRIRWWDEEAVTFRQAAHLPDHDRQGLPDDEIPAHARIKVSGDKPVFFGHYWMSGEPKWQSARAACVDYSAGKGGRLTAYRWDGRGPLSAGQFVSVG